MQHVLLISASQWCVCVGLHAEARASDELTSLLNRGTGIHFRQTFLFTGPLWSVFAFLAGHSQKDCLERASDCSDNTCGIKCRLLSTPQCTPPPLRSSTAHCVEVTRPPQDFRLACGGRLQRSSVVATEVWLTMLSSVATPAAILISHIWQRDSQMEWSCVGPCAGGCMC